MTTSFTFMFRLLGSDLYSVGHEGDWRSSLPISLPR